MTLTTRWSDDCPDNDFRPRNWRRAPATIPVIMVNKNEIRVDLPLDAKIKKIDMIKAGAEKADRIRIKEKRIFEKNRNARINSPFNIIATTSPSKVPSANVRIAKPNRRKERSPVARENKAR